MNQHEAATIVEALRASLEVVPSSWHVAKINRALSMVEPWAMPYRVLFYLSKLDTVTAGEKGEALAKDLREAQAMIRDRLEPWSEARIWYRPSMGKLVQIWRKNPEGRPYRSV